jgi:hypothetical protein
LPLIIFTGTIPFFIALQKAIILLRMLVKMQVEIAQCPDKDDVQQ